MTKRLALTCFLLALAMSATAQLRVNTGISAEEAISRLVGQGVKVSNVRVNCPSEKDRPWGYFADNTGTLGMSEGLLMTTGAASNAVGPNNSASKGQANSTREVNDFDLNRLVRNNEKMFDLCVIEFDVQVFADSLIFEYIFGSEEYPEFIRDFHDVFGFFISGPGIVGRPNIALIPGTNEPISVFNVNETRNSRFYISNGTGSTPFINLFVQYDGYTTKFTSKVAVQPCATYSLKLAICDVKDPNYDAGIFIEGRSLRTKSPLLKVNYQYEKYGIGIEGCNNASLTIARQSMLNTEQVFYLRKTGSALEGVDYSTLPDSVVFLPGEREKVIPIELYEDGETEGIESATFNLLNPCPGLPEIASAVLRIQDFAPYNAPDDSICIGQTVILNTAAPENFSFFWEPNVDLSCIECASPLATPAQDSRYPFLAIDNITGCKSFDTINIKVLKIPEAAFNFLNPPDYTTLDFQFENLSKYATAFNWQFGDGSFSVEANPLHQYRPGDFDGSVKYKVILTAIREQPYCIDTATAIIVFERDRRFLIPNLVTANGDSVNDTFFIKGIKPGFWHLEIRNRFGKMVFNTDTYDLNWAGEGLPPGVYYYLLNNRFKDRVFRGWLQLTK
jgi:hypothetical protein